jgi:hypothetical protein
MSHAAHIRLIAFSATQDTGSPAPTAAHTSSQYSLYNINCLTRKTSWQHLLQAAHRCKATQPSVHAARTSPTHSKRSAEKRPSPCVPADAFVQQTTGQPSSRSHLNSSTCHWPQTSALLTRSGITGHPANDSFHSCCSKALSTTITRDVRCPHSTSPM